MWVIIVLIAVVVAAAAAAIAWLFILIEAAETPLCPRCARRTRRVRTKGNGAADPWEPLATYRCVACDGDPAPFTRALRWSKSKLEPPR
jgi:hypothetical protein